MKLSIAQILKDHQDEIKRNSGKKAPRTRRYSSALRDRVMEFISDGGKTPEISQYLCITRTTLHRWAKEYPKSKALPRKKLYVGHSFFKELKVNDNLGEQIDHFTIETPSGFKIKLDSQQKLVSIVKALEMAS